MIAAIVLAAGTSSRMGRPKQVLPVGGTPLLERTLEAVRASGVDQTVVVLGHEADRVRETVDLAGVDVVVNEAYGNGMSASIRAGLQTLDPRADAVLVVLGDQPFLSPRTLDTLATERTRTGATILVPTFRGVRGNPVLLDRSLTPEMETLTGDVGCRGLFHRHAEDVREVPVDDPGVVLDLDTEAQVQRVEEALERDEDLASLALDVVAGRDRGDGERPFLPPRVDVLSRAEELRVRGEPFVLATVVRSVAPTSGKPGFKALIRPDGRMEGWVGGGCSRSLVVAEALDALRAGQPRLLRFANEGGEEEGVVRHPMECESGGAMDIFVEPYRPRARLILVGDSPVTAALCALGGLLGYEVIVAAPGAAKEDLPESDRFLSDLEELRDVVHGNSYGLVASMGRYDQTALEVLATTRLRYLGLVASQRRAQATLEALRERGVSPDALDRVRNPAGLDLHAETQEEIALSIMAEITEVRRTAAAEPVPAADPATAAPGEERDPVCGMNVSPETPLRATHQGTTYFFCSDRCRTRFEEAPASFL